MLKKEGRIADLLTRRHNYGFSVHNGVRRARDVEAGRESLAQCIFRRIPEHLGLYMLFCRSMA